MTAFDLQTRPAEYSLLELALPGRPATPFGVLLLDTDAGDLYVRCREDAAELAGPEDAEVVELLAEEIEARAKELGGRELFERLEDTLSNALRLGERIAIMVRDFRFTLDRLFETRVMGRREEQKVMPFVTHLPVYSLRAAAGRFGEDMEAEAEGWAEAPPDLRLSQDMFAVHITGRSMLPLIPDGSLAVFRYAPAGSRQGKRVLVWRRGTAQGGGEFTVKVYESWKVATAEGWRHARIRLKPLNPEYEVLELEDETEYRILGEFICVLPESV